jgi:hypothetical protein
MLGVLLRGVSDAGIPGGAAEDGGDVCLSSDEVDDPGLLTGKEQAKARLTKSK